MLDDKKQNKKPTRLKLVAKKKLVTNSGALVCKGQEFTCSQEEADRLRALKAV